MMPEKKQIGDIIKEMRQRLGLSQRQLAIKANVSNTTIFRIEKNTYTYINPDVLERIANVFGTTSDEIIRLTNESNNIKTKENFKEKENEIFEPKQKDESEEPSIEEIEDFLAGQKMLMFKGKPLTEDDLRSVYAFLQFLEKKYGDDSKK